MKKNDPAVISMKSIHPKLYYGLDEAEKMLGMSSGTLIQMGARQDLPLYVIAQDWQVIYRSRTISHGEQIEPPTDESWPKGQPALTDRLITPVRLYPEALARYEFDSTATTRNFFTDNKYQVYFQPETGKHIHCWEGVAAETITPQKPKVLGEADSGTDLEASDTATATVDADVDESTPRADTVSRQIYEFEIPLSALPPGATGIAIASCPIVVMAEDLPKLPEEVAPAPTTEESVTDKKSPISKAPNTFVSALIQLLVEIGRRAASADPPIPFNPLAMPGVKADLQELADKFDLDLKHPPSTFNTYIKGLITFKSGAQPTEFYKTLFSDLFDKFTKVNTEQSSPSQ